MVIQELYSYCTLVFLVCILFMDIALVCRFRTYYLCHGYGVVTCFLLNLVATQLAATLLYATAAVLILVSDKTHQVLNSYIDLFRKTSTSWFISATLVHTIVLICLRIYSVSYGNRFLKFVSSSFNICLVVVKLWFVSLAITMVTVTSATVTTKIVFYMGVSVTGLFSVMCFFCTTERSSASKPCDSTSLPRDQNIDGVRNPQKTFVVFTGVMISFVVFTVPTCILNLYFNLQMKDIDEQISFIVSLWCLVGVLANSVWIWYRLRCTLNHVTGFYSKWSLERNNNNANGDIQMYSDDAAGNNLPKRYSDRVDDNPFKRYSEDRSDDNHPKRYSFPSCETFEQQYASMASLEKQIKKEIM